MAKSPIKRKSAEQYDLDANAWVKYRIRDMLQSLLGQRQNANRASTTISFKGDLTRLGESVRKALDAEVGRIFPRISGKLIGTPSFGSQVYYLYPTAFDDTQTLKIQGFDRAVPERMRDVQRRKDSAAGQALATWQPLKKSTILRKKNNKFFEDTGQLHHYLQGVDGLSKLGASKVTVDTAAFDPGAYERKDVQMARIRVELFPNLPARQRAILTTEGFRPDPTGSLETKMFGAAVGEKLTGPKNPGTRFRYRYRPLVPPVLRWYLAYKLPQVAAAKIAAFNFKKRTGDA